LKLYRQLTLALAVISPFTKRNFHPRAFIQETIHGPFGTLRAGFSRIREDSLIRFVYTCTWRKCRCSRAFIRGRLSSPPQSGLPPRAVILTETIHEFFTNTRTACRLFVYSWLFIRGRLSPPHACPATAGSIEV